MSKISKIEIENFFNKGNLEWNLHSDVNILGGKNGGGKSTILRMCNTLLTADGVEKELHSKFGRICSKIQITLTNGWIIEWDGSTDCVLLLDDSTTFSFDFSIYDNKGNERTYNELHDCIIVNMVNSFEQHVDSVKSYDIQRTYQQMKDPTLLDLMIQDQINLRNKDIAETMEQFMDNPNPEAQSQYSAMTREIYATLDNFFNDYEGKLNSKFVFQRNGHSFGFEALSMGEKQILLIFLTVCNMKHKECVLLMDEPDLSMHVDWKKRLVSALHDLNPNMQLIITTHAPSLVRGWYDKVKEMNELIQR